MFTFVFLFTAGISGTSIVKSYNSDSIDSCFKATGAVKAVEGYVWYECNSGLRVCLAILCKSNLHTELVTHFYFRFRKAINA